VPFFRLLALTVFCALAVASGYGVHRWSISRLNLRCGSVASHQLVFVFRLVPNLAAESCRLARRKPRTTRITPNVAIGRLICAANVGMFYIGGGTWLLLQSTNRPLVANRACIDDVLLPDMFGPPVLLIAGGVLDSDIPSKAIDDAGVSLARGDVD